jgi:hypothetical protein
MFATGRVRKRAIRVRVLVNVKVRVRVRGMDMVMVNSRGMASGQVRVMGTVKVLCVVIIIFIGVFYERFSGKSCYC